MRRWLLAAVPVSLLLGAATSGLKLWYACRVPSSEACVWGRAYYPLALPLETLVFGAVIFACGAIARTLMRHRS